MKNEGISSDKVRQDWRSKAARAARSEKKALINPKVQAAADVVTQAKSVKLTLNKQVWFKLLDDLAYPALLQCLQDGNVAVLIGVPGTGKSTLATKALPLATLISGTDETLQLLDKIDSDLIGEELYRISPDTFIKCRDQVIEHGFRVIITGQTWDDVSQHLIGLSTGQVRVFNLNRFGETNGWASAISEVFQIIELHPLAITESH